MSSANSRTLSGQEFREMFAAAADWLEKSAPDIDALNVFPVPDGDCGTNMLLTMQSAVDEAYRAADPSLSSVAQAMSRGALLGARGNSGVILSQIWRGIAQSLEGKEALGGQEFAEALLLASGQAYKALNNPVEGTILTVIRETAAAAQQQAESDQNDIETVLETAVDAAARSVAGTPDLLPVLKEAGVVDAGGQGLYTLLEGALRYLKGEAEQMKRRKPRIISVETPGLRMGGVMKETEVPWGYSTEFILKGIDLDPEAVRTNLEKWGRNVVVAGDETMIRVHIHAPDPGPVFSYAVTLGKLNQVTIRNLDEQYQDFLKSQREKMPQLDIAVIAVAAGDGLAEVFRSLGAAAVVPGGQTMNPSTRDLLQAVEEVPSNNVIILPDNKNIIPTANQLPPVTAKQVKVVPVETIPQGIGALLAFNYQADLETNVRYMTEAGQAVRTIEVTRSVRSARLGNLDVKENQYIGFLDGELIAAGDSPAAALYDTVAAAGLEEREIITLYYGAGTAQAEAEEVGRDLRQKYPWLQVEVISGGQPYYNYIVSIE